jgi:1-phosphofructokinase/tagatose 6-phosphate kinase
VKILVVCLNPTIQRTSVVENLCIGEVNRVREHRTDASGKGVNAARVLVQIGAEAVHVTQTGGRYRGLFSRLAADDGIDMDPVDADIEIRTGHTIVDAAHHTTTEVVEEGREVTAEVEVGIRERYAARLGECDGVIISGSKAPGFSGELFPWMVAQARQADRFILTDYRGTDLENSLPHRPDVIKPNLVEFVRTFLPQEATADLSEHTENDALLAKVRARMVELYQDHGATTVLTRGAHPALYLEDGSVREEPALSIEAVNTIGSGDAFSGALAFKLISGAGLGEAVAFAHECAAANARNLKPGSIVAAPEND